MASLSAEEQREFAKELAIQKKAVRTELRRGSSVTVAPVRAAPAPPRRRTPWPLLLSVGGAASAVLLGVVILLPRPSEKRPPAPPPVKATEDAATRAAREERLAVQREAEELDARARPLLDREEFAAAAELYERARRRREMAEWNALMDAKVRVVRARADALFATLLQKSADARRQGKEDEVRAVRERVGRWKRPDLTSDLDRHLAGVAPAERPWKPVFDGKSLEFMPRASRPGWEMRDGALVSVGKNAGQTIAEFGDGELRIRFEAKNVDSVYFTLRRTPSEGHKAQWNTAAFRPHEGKPCELLFTCRGESVTAKLNGQPLALESTGRPLRGILQFNSRAGLFRIASMEFRDLP